MEKIWKNMEKNMEDAISGHAYVYLFLIANKENAYGL